MAKHGGDSGESHISNPIAASGSDGLQSERISFSDTTHSSPMDRVAAMQSVEASFMTKDQMAAATPEQLMGESNRMGDLINNHLAYMASLGLKTDDIQKQLSANKHLASGNGNDLEIV